jgi:drug/metabolite transporter (DMT)-like permease
VGAALAVVYLVWGSTFLAIRYAVRTLPPLLMAGARYSIAGGILYGFLRLKGARPPSRSQWLSALVVGALMIGLGNGLLTWSELVVPSGTAALLVAAMPLWMVLLDWLVFGGRRPRLPVGLGLVAGFAGVALLLGPSRGSGGGHAALLSGFAILVGTLGWAYGSLWSRGAAMADPPLLGTASHMLAGGLLLVAAGLALGEGGDLSVRAASTRSLLSFAYLIVLGSLVTYTTYMWLLRHAQASLVSTYAYVNPVVAVFLGWLLAGEAVTARTLVAATVIVGAVALIVTFRRAGPRPPARSLTRAAGT